MKRKPREQLLVHQPGQPPRELTEAERAELNEHVRKNLGDSLAMFRNPFMPNVSPKPTQTGTLVLDDGRRFKITLEPL